IFGAGGNFGHGQGFKNGLQGVEKVEVGLGIGPAGGAGSGGGRFGVFVRANDHFLRSAARGDEADSRFDEAEVGFGGGVNARAVQADFAAASQGEALGRDHYRARRVLDGEINVLELAHGEVEVVPFLLLGSDE